MSEKMPIKKIRISQKTLDGINQLIADYEIDNEAALYRQFIEIGFAFKKKQLDGDIGNGSEFLHIDASKQAGYHTLLLEEMAKKVAGFSDNDLAKLRDSVAENNHKVLADCSSFHKIDKNKIKSLKVNKE